MGKSRGDFGNEEKEGEKRRVEERRREERVKDSETETRGRGKSMGEEG